MEPSIFKPRLKFKLPLKFFKFGHCLEYLRSTTFGCRDIGIRKLEFVAKTQLLSFPYLFNSNPMVKTFAISTSNFGLQRYKNNNIWAWGELLQVLYDLIISKKTLRIKLSFFFTVFSQIRCYLVLLVYKFYHLPKKYKY